MIKRRWRNILRLWASLVLFTSVTYILLLVSVNAVHLPTRKVRKSGATRTASQTQTVLYMHPQQFNETEWLKLLFLLADTQQWVDDLCRNAFMQLPVDKKKLFKKDYYLTATALAHIIERHYYKVNRHPQTGKFHIPVTDILEHIRTAYAVTPLPLHNSCNHCRVLDTGVAIGFDNNGNTATCITVITENGGRIVTAFPSQGPQGTTGSAFGCMHGQEPDSYIPS